MDMKLKVLNHIEPEILVIEEYGVENNGKIFNHSSTFEIKDNIYIKLYTVFCIIGGNFLF